ncbi:MIP/aquaporin family protein [Flavobacterium chuncheonense]|uniref:MIP/aquaporin family protein n=1 Tax=Flavobacterium chuncheonense TaxID=2026653 RepID=A0ABW5YHG4_9FLAO
MIKRLNFFVEFLGTFLLVLVGTGSIIISQEFDYFDDFGIGLAFGGIVWLLIQILGKYSDCHINPAVTFVMFTDRKLTFNKGIVFIGLQLLGALLASFVLHFLFPENVKLGSTLPRATWEEAFIYEFFLSLVLMLVILISTTIEKIKKYAPFLIGFTVFLEAWLAGYICGASMNPARSFGPALVSGNTSVLWLYFLAPILGMLMALILVKAVSFSNIKAILK